MTFGSEHNLLHTQHRQRFQCIPGKVIRRLGCIHRWKPDHQIRAMLQRQPGFVLPAHHGRQTPLREVVRQNADQHIAPGQFSCLPEVVCMALVEWVILCDDAADFQIALFHANCILLDAGSP